jgi:hypothetical protein
MYVSKEPDTYAVGVCFYRKESSIYVNLELKITNEQDVTAYDDFIGLQYFPLE